MFRHVAAATRSGLVTTRRAVARSTLRAASASFSSSANDSARLSYEVVPKNDFGDYLEYSVIHTNRSLNLMSDPFQRVMRDLNNLLKTTYNADKVAIIPGYVTWTMDWHIPMDSVMEERRKIFSVVASCVSMSLLDLFHSMPPVTHKLHHILQRLIVCHCASLFHPCCCRQCSQIGYLWTGSCGPSICYR